MPAKRKSAKKAVAAPAPKGKKAPAKKVDADELDVPEIYGTATRIAVATGREMTGATKAARLAAATANFEVMRKLENRRKPTAAEQAKVARALVAGIGGEESDDESSANDSDTDDATDAAPTTAAAAPKPSGKAAAKSAAPVPVPATFAAAAAAAPSVKSAAPVPKSSGKAAVSSKASDVVAAAAASWNAPLDSSLLTEDGTDGMTAMAQASFQDKVLTQNSLLIEDGRAQVKVGQAMQKYLAVRTNAWGTRGLIFTPATLRVIWMAYCAQTTTEIEEWGEDVENVQGAERVDEREFRRGVKEQVALIKLHARDTYVSMRPVLKDSGNTYNIDMVPVTPRSPVAYAAVKTLAAWAMAVETFEYDAFDSGVEGLIPAADAVLQGHKAIDRATLYRGARSMAAAAGKAKDTSISTAAAIAATNTSAKAAPTSHQKQPQQQQQQQQKAPAPAQSKTVATVLSKIRLGGGGDSSMAQELSELSESQLNRLKRELNRVGKPQERRPGKQTQRNSQGDKASLLPAPRANNKDKKH